MSPWSLSFVWKLAFLHSVWVKMELFTSKFYYWCRFFFPVLAELPVAWQLQFSKQVRKCHKTLHLSFTFPAMPKESPDGPDLTYDRFIKILNKRIRKGCTLILVLPLCTNHVHYMMHKIRDKWSTLTRWMQHRIIGTKSRLSLGLGTWAACWCWTAINSQIVRVSAAQTGRMMNMMKSKQNL